MSAILRGTVTSAAAVRIDGNTTASAPTGTLHITKIGGGNLEYAFVSTAVYGQGFPITGELAITHKSNEPIYLISDAAGATYAVAQHEDPV